MPTTPIRLISALAAGADQKLAAAAVVREAMALDALLPFAREPYRTWLTQGIEATSHAVILDEFDRLCACADSVVKLEGGAPPRGDPSWVEGRYAALGQALVARADLLIALWRGDPARGPGGTAEVVALAAAEGVPTLRLDPRDPTYGNARAVMDAVRVAVARYTVGNARPAAAGEATMEGA